jgi:signal transduction histidine kinase
LRSAAGAVILFTVKRLVKDSRKRWLIGFLMWLGLAVLDSPRQPAVDYTWKSVLVSGIEWLMWASVAPIIVWVDRNLPVRSDDLPKRFTLHAMIGAILALCTAFLHVQIVRALLHPPRARLLGFFPSHVMIYWAIAGVCIAWDYHKQFMERQLRATELEKRLAEARLEALRAQLQPHFLFNALNAVSSQIDLDPRGARRMLEQVGDLLRLSLAHSDAQEISLDQEVAFLDRYVGLQKIRFEDRLEVREDIDPNTLEACVPAFILQPIVENAIHHGIERRAQNGLIEISSVRNNGDVILRVRDNGPGIPAEARRPEGFGIGLSNTRERLRHLYGDTAQSLSLTSEPGKGTLVEIRIPFHPVPPPTRA